MKATALRYDLSWLAAQTEPSGEINPLALATFMDYLPTSSQTRQALISAAPAPTGNAVTDNMLAGLAETIADEAGLPTPAWCATVPPLQEALPIDGTPRMLAKQRAAALLRFLDRGITMPRTSLFRSRPPMDAR